MNIITPDYENRQLNSQKTHQTPTQRDIWEILSQQRTRNEIVNESNNGLFLTDEEIDIIKQWMPNPQIRKIVIQIIDEFGKRICKWENPTSSLLYNVSMDVQYKNKLYWDGYAYQFYAEQLINKLPDWKGFCYFISNNWNIDSNNQYLIEFRNKRAKSIDYRSPDKIQQDPNIKTVSNYESNFTKKGSDTKKVQPWTITKSPISTESTDSQLTQEKVKKQKVRPKYETVTDKDYVKKFKDFKRTENIQTDVPLLSPEDIAFSIYNGWYECITQHKQTKVPSFDVRQNGWIEEFIKKNGKRNWIFSQLDWNG